MSGGVAEDVREVAGPVGVTTGAEGVDAPGAGREVTVAVLVVDRRVLSGGVAGRDDDIVAATGDRVDSRGRVDAGVGAPGPAGSRRFRY